MLNPQNIIRQINKTKDPNNLIAFLLPFMEKNKSKEARKAAKDIRQKINNGQNSIEAIKESAANGSISLENLNQVKKLYQTAKRMGLKINIPKDTWSEVENAIRSANSSSNSKKNSTRVFNGF